MAYQKSRRKSPESLSPACRKTMYHSREEAEDMIRYITENRVVRELRAYLCDACGTWHLTSKSGL
jgi:hypothetical protein